MPNRYCNLTGTNKIKDEWPLINAGFDAVQTDRDGLPFFMARNAIINGNFDIWQRGTSWTNPTGIVFFADRWLYSGNPDGGTPPSLTYSRLQITSGELPNSFYALRVTTDGAGSSFGPNAEYGIFQRIEHGTRYLCGNGKKVTISFYARSSIANKKIGVGLKQRYGTGGSPSTENIISGTVFTLTPSWAKYTVTFTTASLSGKTFGTNNDDYLQLGIYFVWGSSAGNTFFNTSTTETFGGAGTIDIAQVQLCAGDVALPFQPRSVAEELALCQRYYEKSYSLTISPGTIDEFGRIGHLTSITGLYSSSSRFPVRFSVRKRAAPTITLYGPSTGTANRINSDTGADRVAYPVYITDSGFELQYSDFTSANGIFFHYVADAEL